MKVLPQGTKIKTKVGGVEGMVTGVSIRGSSVYYDVTYFAGGLHKNTWMYGFEIEPLVDKPAGFNRDTPPAIVYDDFDLLPPKSHPDD